MGGPMFHGVIRRRAPKATATSQFLQLLQTNMLLVTGQSWVWNSNKWFWYKFWRICCQQIGIFNG